MRLQQSWFSIVKIKVISLILLFFSGILQLMLFYLLGLMFLALELILKIHQKLLEMHNINISSNQHFSCIFGVLISDELVLKTLAKFIAVEVLFQKVSNHFSGKVWEIQQSCTFLVGLSDFEVVQEPEKGNVKRNKKEIAKIVKHHFYCPSKQLQGMAQCGGCVCGLWLCFHYLPFAPHWSSHSK